MSSSVLSDATRSQILALTTRYPNSRSALLPSLYLVQAERGFISEESMAEVGDLLHLTAADVKSVASFYTMFFKKPIGRHLVEICTNLACKARNCAQVEEHILKTLNVEFGGTTADGRFTVEEVECLGQCEFAPMMEIDLEPYGPLNTPAQIDAALAKYS